MQNANELSDPTAEIDAIRTELEEVQRIIGGAFKNVNEDMDRFKRAMPKLRDVLKMMVEFSGKARDQAIVAEYTARAASRRGNVSLVVAVSALVVAMWAVFS